MIGINTKTGGKSYFRQFFKCAWRRSSLPLRNRTRFPPIQRVSGRLCWEAKDRIVLASTIRTGSGVPPWGGGACNEASPSCGCAGNEITDSASQRLRRISVCVLMTLSKRLLKHVQARNSYRPRRLDVWPLRPLHHRSQGFCNRAAWYGDVRFSVKQFKLAA